MSELVEMRFSTRKAVLYGLALLACSCVSLAAAQVGDEELLRQQERERALRERQEQSSDVHLERTQRESIARLPEGESPCFPIELIVLGGDEAERFSWALRAADPDDDPATGRCLGAAGINLVMTRIQNALISRGYVTTRVLATPQDLKTGLLNLTVIPGRIRDIRFAEGSGRRASLWNAVPAREGELLNLRDIEQALENFQRVPTVTADIQIVPAESPDAKPGESDLVISWQQRGLLRTQLTFDDSGSRGTGRMQAGATLSVDDLMRANELFYVSLGRGVFNGDGKSTLSWTAHYSMPLDYWLFAATVSGYDYEQTVAGFGEDNDIVYRGPSRNAELRASYLLYRNATMKTGAYGRGWWRQSRSFINDAEVNVQRRRTAGWEAGLTHRQIFGAATFDGSVAYRRGTGAFDALPSPEEVAQINDPSLPLEGTSRMRIVTADAQFNLPFSLAGQAMRYNASGRAQWDSTPLTPQDRFAIGGRYSVRGFDGERALIGERGWWLRNEIGLQLGTQETYAGVDYGSVDGRSADVLSGDDLMGAVIGLRGGWRMLSWDGFIGTPLAAPEGYDQDDIAAGFSLAVSL